MPKLPLTTAYLEHYPEHGGPVERIPLLNVPFTIGRSETADYTVYSSKVSKEHAAIVQAGDRFAVRDLDSTNGTFVNGQRTSEQALADGDIIHIAHVEFCFRHRPTLAASTGRTSAPPIERTQTMPSQPPDSLIRGTELLRAMVDREAVDVLYQPIVDLKTRAVVAYEALARGRHPELTSSPEGLLELADRCGVAVELSRLFCRLAIVHGRHLPAGAKIFVNVHPRDLAAADLADALDRLRRHASEEHPLVFEIAESSVTDVSAMARHKEAFATRGFELAYDDFGAGQARLLELTETPPDYLKLDKTLIQGLEAAPARQEMVVALLHVADTLGVRVIAEGIETEATAEVCRQLGCGLGQGFLFSSAT